MIQDATIPVAVITGLLIAAGILGLIVPVLPGLAICLFGVLLWSGVGGTQGHWIVFGICVVIALIGWVLQWTRPNKHLKSFGVPGRSRLAGVALGAVGFFVIPVVGLFIGFVAGVYLAEHARLRNPAAAWTSTRAAVRAALLSVGIELAAAVAVAATWAVGLLTVG